MGWCTGPGLFKHNNKFCQNTHPLYNIKSPPTFDIKSICCMKTPRITSYTTELLPIRLALESEIKTGMQ